MHASMSIAVLLVATGSSLAAQLTPAGDPLELVPPGPPRFTQQAVGAGPGGFVLVWSQIFDPSECCAGAVMVRRFDLSGSAVGPPTRTDRLRPQDFLGRILPDVAVGLDGGQVAVWHDIDDRNVHARSFAASGEPRDRDFVVNTTRRHWQLYPRVAANPNGSGYLVLWTTGDVGDDGVPWPHDAFVQRLDALGAPVGTEQRINAGIPAEDESMALAIASTGDALVGWQSEFPSRLEVRRFDRDGVPAGSPLEAAAPISRENGFTLCALGGGRFLAAWVAGHPEDGLYARSIETDGTLGPLQAIESTGARLPRLACSPFDEALLVYAAGHGIRARQLDPLGTPLGPAIVVAEDHGIGAPSAALGPGGLALVTWTVNEGGDTPSIGIDGRLLRLGDTHCSTAAGTDLCLAGGRFRVRAHWNNPYGVGAGIAHTRPLSDDTASFWFFDPDNLELTVKLLDGRDYNGRFWFFSGALSTVEHWIEVTDTGSGRSRTYFNPRDHQAGIADTTSFLDEGASTLGLEPLPEPARAEVELGPAELAAVPTSVRWRAFSTECDGLESLCLAGGRFAVMVSWNGGSPLPFELHGTPVPLTTDTGAFWFFDPANIELVVKVLDARTLNGRFWVLWGGLTTLGYDLTVRDLETGESRQYSHPVGSLAGGRDLAAFPLSNGSPMSSAVSVSSEVQQ